MKDFLFSPIKLSELETLIENSVKRAITKMEDQLDESTGDFKRPLNIREAAEFLDLTVPTIYSKVSNGELPFMKRTKRLYFSRRELIDYLKVGRKKSHSETEAEADQFLSNHKKRANNG